MSENLSISESISDSFQKTLAPVLVAPSLPPHVTFGPSAENPAEGAAMKAHSEFRTQRRSQLQPRDLELLLLCYEQQFLTVEHADAVFSTHPSIPYRRIALLEKAGFFRKEYHPVLGKFSVIRLTAFGQKIACQNGATPVSPVIKLNPTTLIHDALVTSARVRLSRIWNARFFPERAIKTKDFPEIPDGIFHFPSGKGVAIEVENSDKGRFRFQKLLSRWKFHSSTIKAVLYIASHEGLYRSLRSYLDSTPIMVEPLIGLVLWSDLKTGMPLVHTQIGSADLFSKRELF